MVTEADTSAGYRTWGDRGEWDENFTQEMGGVGVGTVVQRTWWELFN